MADTLSPDALAAWRAGIEAAAQKLGRKTFYVFLKDGTLFREIPDGPDCNEQWRQAVKDAGGYDEIGKTYWAGGPPEAEAIRAIPPPAAVPSPWQPISTAPKDGTRVLLSDNTGRFDPVYVAKFRQATADYWLSDDGEWVKWNVPTHWQPLPPPPARPDARPTQGGGVDGRRW